MTRGLALDIAGTIEAPVDVAERHLDDLSFSEAQTLMGARDIAEGIIERLWGTFGSGPDGRL
jgi:hypothetical protein